MKAPSPRIARRREQARARILSIASRRFAERGVEGARLDEIADEADLARGTLYSHFGTKDALLFAILEPVLQEACEGVHKLKNAPADRAVDGLLELYLKLWSLHRDALRVAWQAREEPLGSLTAVHVEFVNGVLAIFEKARHAYRLRSADPALAGRVLWQTAIPLLELYEAHPRFQELWLSSMRGLLLQPGPSNAA